MRKCLTKSNTNNKYKLCREIMNKCFQKICTNITLCSKNAFTQVENTQVLLEVFLTKKLEWKMQEEILKNRLKKKVKLFFQPGKDSISEVEFLLLK